MQIVIKISEGFIDKMNSIKDDRELSYAQLLTVYRGFHAMLQNGVVLPKGHGRLIDADALRADYSFCWDGEELLSVNSLIIAPTIIEADKA